MQLQISECYNKLLYNDGDLIDGIGVLASKEKELFYA